MFATAHVQFTVAIPAAYVNRLEYAAAEEVLDAKLLSYDERLRGILLAYDDLQGGEVGVFQDEQPDVLYSFQANLTLYSPRVKSVFKATVSEISATTVYLLAVGLFPVVVSQTGFPLNSLFSKSNGVKSLVSDEDKSTVLVGLGETYWVQCVDIVPTMDTIHVHATFQLV